MTPAEQAARDAIHAAETVWRSEIMPTNDRRHHLEIHYIAQAIEQARREERETCARLAENPYGDDVQVLGREEPGAVGRKIAAAIRARAEEEKP